MSSSSVENLDNKPNTSAVALIQASLGGLPSGATHPTLSPIVRALRHARSLALVLRTTAFDTSTEAGRSLERYRLAALTTLTSVVARGVSVVTLLFTVRLTVHYLGTERYGLWMTITSVVSMLTFADLGVGNGLLNAIAGAHGRDDVESARKYVSSAFFILSGIAAVLLGSFVLVYPFVPWRRVFNVTSPLAAHEAGPAVFVFTACFLLNMPLDVVQRVQRGRQEGFATNLWTAAGSLAGLGALVLAMRLHGGLAVLLLALSAGQLVSVLGNWIQVFGWRHPELFPKLAFWDRASAREIAHTGMIFLTLQACSIFAVPIDNIIIAQIRGPGAVTQYSVPLRPFLLVNSGVGVFLVPLWPAYSEALARGDVKWVKSTLRRSLAYGELIFAPVVLALAVLGKPIVHLWVGPQIQPTYALLFGMAVWIILTVPGSAFGMFLTGANVLKLQVAIMVPTAVVSVFLKIVMARAFGLPGVIWAMAFAAFAALVLTVVFASRVPRVAELLRT